MVVVNFVNRKNAADQRVYELLDQKFKLFKGVFGASDEVLGSIESGVDFEKRIAAIYQSCRTEDEINSAFDALQKEMDEPIQEGMRGAKEKLLENFDTDVHEKLKINLRESKAYLETYEKWLWDISLYFLGDNAVYAADDYSFTLKHNPFPGEDIDEGPYKIGKNIDDAHIYRPGHPLAERILQAIKTENLPSVELVFDYSNYGPIISPIKKIVGSSGILQLSELTIDSFETEDALILTALMDDGELLEEDVAKKLFMLCAQISHNKVAIRNEDLQQKEQEKVKILAAGIAERNSEFFDDEVDKLDKCAEDVKKSLEIELKRLDIDIKTMKTNAKKVLNLAEKVKLQRDIKDWEKKRNEMRQKLYQAQDEVDVKKESLLERVEAQLNQKTTLTPLFTIRFEVI